MHGQNANVLEIDSPETFNTSDTADTLQLSPPSTFDADLWHGCTFEELLRS